MPGDGQFQGSCLTKWSTSEAGFVTRALGFVVKIPAWRLRLAGTDLFHQRLSTGKACVDLVPMADFVLTQFPAQVHDATINHSGKIDQAFRQTFRFGP